MIALNLKAESAELQAIKEYLQENVNAFLADKINNGVYIQKDGKRLLNKKDLASFMKYACEEARKMSAKGATSACVKDDIVFGWAMHYFEENDIIGTLYNEDGSVYKPTPKKSSSTVQRVPAPIVPTKIEAPKPRQFNLFDMMAQTEQPQVAENTKKETDDNIPEDTDEIVEDITELNVDMETGEILPPEPKKKTISLQQCSPLYQKYMYFQNQYPQSAIAYRVGDFFEVFGDYAIKISNTFDLTLTGRECGLPERVPMIGFPYHAAEMYFHKISERLDLVVVEDNVATPYILEETTPVIDENNDNNNDFEEELALRKFFDTEALSALYELFEHNLDIQ